MVWALKVTRSMMAATRRGSATTPPPLLNGRSEASAMDHFSSLSAKIWNNSSEPKRSGMRGGLRSALTYRPTKLRLARHRLVGVARADACLLPVRDESVAVALGAYFHADVEDFASVVADIARCLRPGHKTSVEKSRRRTAAVEPSRANARLQIVQAHSATPYLQSRPVGTAGEIRSTRLQADLAGTDGVLG
jgi:hypothetical protein